MNVILHGETETRMHLQDMDSVQHKITVPVFVFTNPKNKWERPVYETRHDTYRFLHQIGDYCHYKLETHKEN